MGQGRGLNVSPVEIQELPVPIALDHVGQTDVAFDTYGAGLADYRQEFLAGAEQSGHAIAELLISRLNPFGVFCF